MAKQLNLFSTGQVIATPLHAEMQQSYLEYAMSVIVGRALPDVRDGLKPVHRRILYAMHELGLMPDRPYRKCARVVGDVLGKYHPHGDQAVYDALVRMVQDFSCRYPLLDGHGNFGSVDNDPPAAMRYTETRLAPIGREALLLEIGEATVDFTPNFDNSQAEPTVLPARLPVLLINGCAGIAVGMATNVPPHNLGEIVDGAIALIDRPDLPDEKLFKLIPAPDFPTGGEIVGTEGIESAYRTGRGSIMVRGVAKFERFQGSRGRKTHERLVVTELPYQVNKAAWIEKIADLVNHGKIEGIADVRDESDRSGMRVVVELKRDADRRAILDNLYKQTPLQSTFGAIMLALVNGQPRQLTLRQMLQEFLNFREVTLTRQYSYELQQAQKRLHLVEGLRVALARLDATIDILRNAPDGTTAKATLQDRLQLSDRQADAILGMPMRRLTGMEQQNLQAEFEQLSDRIRELQRLLGDREELFKALKKELRSLKRKYGNPRRTKLANGENSSQSPKTTLQTPKTQTPKTQTPKPQAPPEKTWVEFSYQGYVGRTSTPREEKSTAKSQKKSVQFLKNKDDFTVETQCCLTTADVLAFAKDGKVYSVSVKDIPPSSKSRGIPLVNLLPQSSKGESERTIAAQFVLSDYSLDYQTILLTQQGRIKRLPLSEFAQITGRGLTAMKLKDGDRLCYACLTKAGEQLLIATTGGRILRLEVNDEQVPILGRAAQGYQALRLRKQEKLAGCICVGADDSLLMVSQQGYAKRISVHLLGMGRRGDIGTQALQFANKTDAMAGIVPAIAKSEVILASTARRLWRVPTDSFSLSGRDGCGSAIVQLNQDEKIADVSLLLPASVGRSTSRSKQ